MRFLPLVLKNLARNRLRSLLTFAGVICQVAVLGMIMTFIGYLDELVAERSRNVGVIVSERHGWPGSLELRCLDRFTFPHCALHQELRRIPGFHAQNISVWDFVVFTLDRDMKDRNLLCHVVATYPEKMTSIIDDLEGIDPRLIERMRRPPRTRLDNTGVLIGANLMDRLGLRVGDTFRAWSVTHRDGSLMRRPIEMEFEVVGAIAADNRWHDVAFVDHAYLDRVLRERKCDRYGKVTYLLLRFDDLESARQAGGVIERHLRDLKCETASATYSRFMGPFQDILWSIKYLLAPGIWFVIVVIFANALGITVRERKKEIAVLKVLGFTPRRILSLVLGESLLAGVVAGFLGAATTYATVNYLMDGFRVSGFPALYLPGAIFWWGPALGTSAALVGGLVPACNAARIRVVDIFARVT